jgi:hypothetical protein
MLRTDLFVFGSVESDDIHIRSAVVDTKQVGMRLACVIAVIGAVNSCTVYFHFRSLTLSGANNLCRL